MKTYELTYIISPEMNSEEVQAKAQELESAIQSREGIILKQFNPVAKTLAFPIGKKASGFFGVIEFQLEAEKLLEVKSLVQKDGKIVRHMVIIKEPVRIRKQRRTRVTPSVAVGTETITELEPAKEKKSGLDHAAAHTQEVKEKVELKDIEEQLDELLGE